MNDDPLSPESIIEFLQKKLCLKGYPPLSLQEEMIIHGILHRETYEAIANTLYISPGRTRNIASQLFRRLSQLFEYKITKSNFWLFIRQFLDKDQKIDQKIQGNQLTANLEESSILLLIDDQVENLIFLKTILSQANYHVRTVKSGRTALEFMHKINPDLILLDILMPDMTGYEVCQSLKQNPKYREIPIIFLSAVSDLTDKVKAFNLGACDYITKPFEEVEVLARVSYQLALKSQRRALNNEIKAHQATIADLTQSRSILASILNHSPYGIAALAAIRNPDNGEVVDFTFILVNPIFTEIFSHLPKPIKEYPNCTLFFQDYNLNWLPQLINTVATGKTFQTTSLIADQTIEVEVRKLGDGVSLTLTPMT